MIAQGHAVYGVRRYPIFSRTRKPEWEEKGFSPTAPLKELLSWSQAVFTCLNKNVILLGEEEFDALGTGENPFQ